MSTRTRKRRNDCHDFSGYHENGNRGWKLRLSHKTESKSRLTEFDVDAGTEAPLTLTEEDEAAPKIFRLPILMPDIIELDPVALVVSLPLKWRIWLCLTFA